MSDQNTTRRRLALIALALPILLTSGCRFSVGMLRSVLGDTMVPSAFQMRTTVDLSRGEKRLLVLCSATHTVTSDEASLPIDVLTGVATRLRQQGIEVVDPDDVANWIDTHGAWDDLEGLASEFEADYIAVIHIASLNYSEPNSSSLYRASAKGDFRVYEVVDAGTDDAFVTPRYDAPINETYPKSHPISADQTSESMFRKQAMQYLTDGFARHFHSYHERETI